MLPAGNRASVPLIFKAPLMPEPESNAGSTVRPLQMLGLSCNVPIIAYPSIYDRLLH